MKANQPATPDIRTDALARLERWDLNGKSMEDMASIVGCSLRSIQKWLDGKRMTRLSARAILAAKEPKL